MYLNTHLFKARTDKYKVNGTKSHLRYAQKYIDQELACGRPSTRQFRTTLETHFDRLGEIRIFQVSVFVFEHLRTV